MYEPEEILNAAEVIFPILPKLLDATTAAQLQQQLQQFIITQDIESIWQALDQYPQTRHWRSKYLEQSVANRSGSQLDGDMVAQPSGLIYACPHCDYRDVVFFIGMNPDSCPNHPDAVLYRI